MKIVDPPVDPWTLDSDGMLAIPDTAGLGIVLNMDAVEKHTQRAFTRAMFA